MSISFEKAPVVEIIAELRWGLPKLEPNAPIQITAAPPTPAQEAFFARLGAKMAADGFTVVERLVPQGFPAVPFQPIYRFRKSLTSVGTPLYQVGTKVFSAHMTPPYQSWDQFEPALSYGIESLLGAQDRAEKPVDFSGATVRYINAFAEDLMENRPISEFMLEVLGLGVSLPSALTKFLKPGTAIEPVVRVSFVTDNDYQVLLNVAKGLINQTTALIMDTTVSSSNPFPPQKDVAVNVLNEAQKIIHDSFVGMTAKIHHLMKPRGQQH